MTSHNHSELIAVRDNLLLLLDQSLGTKPEWQALRTILRLLDDARSSSSPPAKVDRQERVRSVPGYTQLAKQAIEEKGAPITTPDLIEYIRKHRPLDPDIEKAKINVSSALSRDKEFISIRWGAGKAWWLNTKPTPSPEVVAMFG